MHTGPSPLAEMPLLMTAYEDSYHSYTASLADVEARLQGLCTREDSVHRRLDTAAASFAELQAQVRGRKADLEEQLRQAHRQQVDIQEKLRLLHRRQEELHTTNAQQRQMHEEEEQAMATQEAYWTELLTHHQEALAALTARRGASLHRPAPPSPPPSLPYGGRTPHPPSQPRASASNGSSGGRSLRACWADAVNAAQADRAAALAALLRECPEAVRCTDAQGNTLLHIACAVEPPSGAAVRCCLSHGASVDVWNEEGLTPFHVACLNLQDINHVVKNTLLTTGGVSVNQRSEFGETAAHLLASHDAFLPSLEFVIDHHADLTVRAMVAGRLRTPLEVAEFYGNEQTQAVTQLLRLVSSQ